MNYNIHYVKLHWNWLTVTQSEKHPMDLLCFCICHNARVSGPRNEENESVDLLAKAKGSTNDQFDSVYGQSHSVINWKDVLVRNCTVATAPTVSGPTLTNIHLVLSDNHLELRNESPTSESDSVRFKLELLGPQDPGMNSQSVVLNWRNVQIPLSVQSLTGGCIRVL